MPSKRTEYSFPSSTTLMVSPSTTRFAFVRTEVFPLNSLRVHLAGTDSAEAETAISNAPKLIQILCVFTGYPQLVVNPTDAETISGRLPGVNPSFVWIGSG